uniref:M96 mating-specific protein family n=1 Tax=Globisporangium ultimum (strain ATCC 200006 / CBS 805.95 / DAOM BR144) TaxID=431595 RepID=K3W8T1_GLOUD
MATFLLEDEQVATLEEVLGFIDTHEPLSFALDGDASWEEDTSSSKGTASDHSSDSEHLDVLPLPVLLAEPPAKRGSHRNQPPKACAEQPRSKSTYTEATKKAITKYRKRNKTEIIELREQVLQLTSRLANLRERSENAQKTASARRMAAATMSRFSNGPVTREQAMTEFQLLQQSESLNRKLKEAVKRHAKVNKSIDDVFRKQTIQQNMALLRELETPKARQLYIPMEPVVQNTMRIFQDLYRDLHACYLDTPSVSEAINVRTSSKAFSNSSVYEDPSHGRVYELTTNTPCAFSLQYLKKYFWGRIGGSDFKEKMGYTYKYSKTDSDGSNSEKHSTATIDCEVGEILVDTVMVMRKFEEPNRTVFVGNAIVIPQGTGLLFRERIWIIVSEVPTAPGTAPRSVIQTYFRNHETKSFAGASSTSPQSAYIRDFVQQAQIEKMRSAMLFIQTVLLQQQTDLHNEAFVDVSPYTLPCPSTPVA